MTTESNVKSRVKALNDYFNIGVGKVPLRQFQAEIKALSEDEKQFLAEGACAVMGWTLSATVA